MSPPIYIKFEQSNMTGAAKVRTEHEGNIFSVKVN
jgi:hypothetical protein